MDDELPQQDVQMGDFPPLRDADGPARAEVPEDMLPLPALLWGARHLKTVIGQRSGHLQFVSPDLDSRTVFQRVAAAAEAACAAQCDVLEKVTKYVAQMQKAGRLQSIAFIEHVSYDETAMDIRASWTAGQAAERGLHKVFVMMTEWCVVLQDTLHAASQPSPPEAQFLVLRGQYSPQARVSAAATGEGIFATLQSGFSLPHSLCDTFGVRIRLCETDEAGSNGRGEAITLSQRPQEWWHLHLYCMCHKVHACAQRTWAIAPLTTSGIIHSCLQMTTGGAMKKLREACVSLAHSQLQVTSDSLPDSATAFRHQVLALFEPHASGRRRALVRTAATILNGDWRAPQLQHRCHPGCCQSYEESVQKVSHTLCRLVAGLRPPVLSKGNWSSWSESIVLLGLGGAIHGFIGRAFLLAFSHSNEIEMGGGEAGVLAPQAVELELHLGGGAPVAGEAAHPPQADFDTDKLARLRAERAKSEDIAKAFFQGPYFTDIYLLRSALEGERLLMAAFLRAVSAGRTLKDMFGDVASRSPLPILALARGEDIHSMLDTTYREFLLASTCLPGQMTEATRSTMLRIFLRPLAVLVQLAQLPSRGFPYKLFHVIYPDRDFHTTMEEIRASPRCLLDPFTKKVLQSFDAGLMSAEALKILLHEIAGMQLQTHTALKDCILAI